MQLTQNFQKKYNTRIFILILSIISFVLLIMAALIVGLMREPFSILTYPSDGSIVVKNSSKSEAFKSQTIHGEFIAKENNLGILAVRFDTYNVKNSEPMLFRIKEKKAENWFYVNNYRTRGLHHDRLFTFGFPKVLDSKGKKYEFEIISKQKGSRKIIGLSSIKPTAVTKYQFSKSDIVKDAGSFLSYSIKKVKNIITNLELTYGFLIEGLLYYLLLLCVLLFFFTKDKYFPNLEAVILMLLAFIILDIATVIDLQNGMRLMVVLIVWIFLIKHYLVDSSILFLIAVFLVVLAAILLIFGQKMSAEMASYWIYIIMLIGLIQVIWQIHEKSHKNDYKVLITPIFSLTKSKKLLWSLSKVKILLRYTQKVVVYISLKVITFYKIRPRSFKGYVLWGVKIVITFFLLILFINTVVIPLFYGYKHENFVSVINTNMKPENPTSNFYIQDVEPALVHHGDNIVVFGEGFNLVVPAKFMSNYGELSARYWSDKIAIFSVPLHWKVGEVMIWAEKQNENSDFLIKKSNVVKIKVIDRLGPFNSDDIAYFRQIKYLDNTTKNANNFRNYKFGKWIVRDGLTLF